MLSDGKVIPPQAVARIDWDTMLRDGNRWYDRTAAALYAATAPPATDLGPAPGWARGQTVEEVILANGQALENSLDP